MNLVIDGVVFCGQTHGGVSRIYAEMLPLICDTDPSVRIELLTQRPPLQAPPVHERIAHRRLPNVRPYLRPSRLWAPHLTRCEEWVARLAVGAGRGRIWHSTYYTTPPAWRGRQVVTVLDMVHELHPDVFADTRGRVFREQKRRAIARADAIVCISETTRQDVARYYGLDRAAMTVVSPACSEVFRRLTNADAVESPTEGRPFLLYVGGRPTYKQFWFCFETLAGLPESERVDLVAVGRPWSDAEKARLHESGMAPWVHLLTGVDDQRLCELYNSAAAFLYPSRYEGFGIPLLEALQCGCPIIASDIPTSREVAGDCPSYFAPGDPEGLWEACRDALSHGRDPERQRRYDERVARYSWQGAAQRMLKVYRSLDG